MSLSIIQRVRVAAALVTLAAVLSAGSAAAQPTTQTALEVFNDPTTALSPDVVLLHAEDARLTRREDGIAIEITMDVPTPGTYVYPEGIPPERQAAPEAYTLWAFVFNHPENCVEPDPPFSCGGADFTESVKAGIYGLGAHVPSIDHSGGAFEFDRASDGRMTLTGEISVGDPQRSNMPPDSLNFPLENPMGAEVHFAVAPHGQIDPSTLVTELYQPVGEPFCGCWWVGLFLPPTE